MQGKHFRNVDHRTAADRDQALDAGRNVLFDRIDHIRGRLTLAIGLDEQRAALRLQRLDELVIQEFIGQDKIGLPDVFRLDKSAEGILIHHVRIHFEFFHHIPP